MKPCTRLYYIVYQTKAPDYEGITEKAKYLKVKLEFGGGRKTRGGESPNAQIIINLENINGKISVGRTGRVIVYYPSKVILKKCLETLLKCYVPPIKMSDIICQGPFNPLSRAFELTTIENWNGSGYRLSEAIVVIHQWLDPKTGDYTFVMPEDDGRVEIPGDSSFEYSGNVTMRIRSIDKDDENGKVIVSGESARWQAMKEIKRICKENKLTQEVLKRARENPKKNEYKEDWKEFDLFFEIL